ncbi:MAG: R3H domain-containing nucleic acid-binding protein, partial [Bradymonadaceae bacterium]
MTNEPNQTDADETDEPSDDPIDGSNSQGASATTPGPPAAAPEDEPDEELTADDGPDVPPPSDADSEEDEAETGDLEGESDAEADSLAEDTSDPGLAEDTSDPGLAEDTSDPGLTEESSEVEETEADDGEEPEEADEEREAEEAAGDGEETAEAEEAAADEAETEQEEEEEEPDESLDLPEYIDLHDQGAEWLAGLFERMNFDAEGEIFDEDGEPRVDISGPDADRLLGVGKLGPKAIEGIETLMQSVFSEDDGASDLYVDVGDKRAERKEMLQRVADDLADRAVDLHKSVTVSGLNSTERRIIHRRLRDYDGVDTESVGDGIFRRLRI